MAAAAKPIIILPIMVLVPVNTTHPSLFKTKHSSSDTVAPVRQYRADRKIGERRRCRQGGTAGE